MAGNVTDSDSPRESAWNFRSRPIVSCLNCRRKKQTCDRRQPCNSCIRSGKPNLCQYAPGSEPNHGGDGEDEQPEETRSRKRQRTDSQDQGQPEQVATSDQINTLEARVAQLEKAMGTLTQSIRTLVDRPIVDHDSSATILDVGLLPNPVQKRTREFALYKPLCTLFPDVQSFVDRLEEDELSDELSTLANDLQSLSKLFKTSRATSTNFHIHDKISDVLAHMEQLLPIESACKILIDIYFQAFEGPLRVLHPIAKTQFRAFFTRNLIQSQRATCIPMLLAVISAASTLATTLECDDPRLHGQEDGVGAYQLLRNYLALLSGGQWREVTTIQIAALTLKPHKSSPLDVMQRWQWSGEIVRRAMAAGVHDISSNASDVYESEIKRRLWLTILEIDLASAVACGMPATCPSWDLEAPASINDNKIHLRMDKLPRSSDLDEWTDGICQHVLAQSFNDRRAAYASVSSHVPATYETMLQHTRHLEQIIYDLPKVFRFFPASDHASDSPYRLVTKMELDFLLRRPLIACYAVYGAEMPGSDDFKEARIPWIQNCSFSMCFQDLFDPKFPMLDLPSPEGLWDFYYNVYRWEVDQFFLSNCLELQRLRSLDKEAADVANRTFQGHALRDPVKIKGWTIEAITKSLEDTIDPLSRRLGRFGSDFDEVVRWVSVIGALRVNPSCSRRHAMKNELQSLVAALTAQHGSKDVSTPRRIHPLTPQTASVSASTWLKDVLQGYEDMSNS